MTKTDIESKLYCYGSAPEQVILELNELASYIEKVSKVNNTNWAIVFEEDEFHFYCGSTLIISLGKYLTVKFSEDSEKAAIDYVKRSNLSEENKENHLSAFIDFINDLCNKNLKQPNYDFDKWYVSCNPELFDVDSAFDNLPQVDWKQSNSASNIKVDDIVYIYESHSSRKLKYKCIVRQTKIPSENTIDDSEYVLQKDTLGSSDYYMRLEPLCNLTGNAYDYDRLQLFDFKANQSTCRLSSMGPKIDEYLILTENLKVEKEIDFNKYDASYTLLKKVIEQYASLPNLDACNFKDLNLIYFSVIGTWKSNVDSKKNRIDESHLPEDAKIILKKTLDELWNKTEAKQFIHTEEYGSTNMGMFGTGIGTIGGSSKIEESKEKESSQKFIKLCINLYNAPDETTALDMSETELKDGISGLGASSVSFILHCINPYYFPIFIRQEDEDCIYKRLGINVLKIKDETEYINNTKKIKEYRDNNFTWKNYRIIDLLNKKINYLQNLYDKGLKTRPDIFETWYKEYVESATRFTKCCKNKKWTEKDILYLIKEKKNGISDLTQKNFDNSEVDKIIADWNSIEPLLDEIGSSQKMTEDDYDNLIELLKQYTAQNKTSAYHRVIASILPGVVTTMMRTDLMKAVCEDLRKHIPDYPEITNKWLTDNLNFIKYCKQNVSFKEKWHVSVFSWFLYDDKVKEQKRKEDEMKHIEEFTQEVKVSKNIIFTGAPGTGKTYLAEEIAKYMNAKSKLIQFHPSYDYTDFVEGLRPFKQGDNIVFKRMDGEFKSFCKEAINDPDNNYVLIIDEINRGEVAKIFGETFYAIDIGYRGDPKKAIITQYNNLIDEKDNDVFKAGFYVPNNLYIIGTMNDIDRSVESIDFAFRRRFTWKEITAESTISMLYNQAAWVPYGDMPSIDIIDKLKNRLKNLNEEISKPEYGLSSAYHIGASYLLRYASYAAIDENSAIDKLWENHLKGVLSEYLRGRPQLDNIINNFKTAFYNTTDTNSNKNDGSEE